MAKKISIEKLKSIRDKEAKRLLASMPKPRGVTEREKLILDIRRIRAARRRKIFNKIGKGLQTTGKVAKVVGRGAGSFLQFVDDITTKPETRLKRQRARDKLKR